MTLKLTQVLLSLCGHNACGVADDKAADDYQFLSINPLHYRAAGCDDDDCDDGKPHTTKVVVKTRERLAVIRYTRKQVEKYLDKNRPWSCQNATKVNLIVNGLRVTFVHAKFTEHEARSGGAPPVGIAFAVAVADVVVGATEVQKQLKYWKARSVAKSMARTQRRKATLALSCTCSCAYIAFGMMTGEFG